ncbi:DUF7946 domain-containing protein [Paracoccus solventivorans]|uniref:DUF7946 domain-containing protein n=1 Tax=Paracoccus solventivorans TaxID=53463 RepID=UPI0011601B1E|nr:hypothetical protein [Paracoccus solventivorans]
MGDIAFGSFSYDGLMATMHRLPARDLSPALMGLDRIVSSLYGALETGIVQKKAPRSSSLVMTVGEPRAGSFELAWITQTAPGLLPLLPDFTGAIQSNLIEHFINYVMLWFGGRRREADKIMDKMLDLLAAERERAHEDRQRERDAVYADMRHQREHMRQLLHDQALALHGAAKLAVAPIGKSASTFAARARGDSPVVDEATADAIRAKEDLEVSDILDMTFRIEGIRDQRRVLFVFDPEDAEGERILPAIIGDPEFERPGNVYKRAYAESLPITLTGKTTRIIDGPIKTFHAISAQIVTGTPEA